VPAEVAASVHEALMEQAEMARRRLSARLATATKALAAAEQARAADATALAAALTAKEQVQWPRLAFKNSLVSSLSLSHSHQINTKSFQWTEIREIGERKRGKGFFKKHFKM